MSVSLGLEGTRASTIISEKDFQTIKSASDRDHIGNAASRLWDRIADWFSGTDRTEAKKLAFDLYSPSVTDQNKVKAFDQLREMAGAKFKDEFQTKRFDNVDCYKLFDFRLHLVNEHIDYKSAEIQLKHCVESSLHTPPALLGSQFKADFFRRQEDGFTINSKSVSDLAEFDQFSDHEKRAIYTICHQGLYREIAKGIPCPCLHQSMSFDVTKEPDGALAIKFHQEKDIAMDFEEHYFEDLADKIFENPSLPKSVKVAAEIRVSFDRFNVDLDIRSADYIVNYGLV